MIPPDALNPRLLKAEYAVRGPIVLRAQQLEEKGQRIMYCNIGNPQALRQKPLTFSRQLLSLLEYPQLIDSPEAASLYPGDVLTRARTILRQNPEGLGAYSQSVGLPFVREAVARFIERRDGIPARKEQIILTDGASKGVQAVILALLRQSTDAFMIPIPQYPLYSATLALQGGGQIGYYLDEAGGWQLREELLEEALGEGRKTGLHPVGLVVINPGNPTGGVLSPDAIRMVIRFARRNDLAILADEVYQENVYDPSKPFHSFARAAHEMGESELPLFSVHSVSKGFLGECGHRGGYLECRNTGEAAMAQFVKLQSIFLCPNLPGQISTYAMVAPPKEGDESFPLFDRERRLILDSLKRKAVMLGKGLNAIEGLSVDIPPGAMYAFVRLELPEPAGMSRMPDDQKIRTLHEMEFDYCLKLLEQTGICVVPGAGFGQQPGTLHFRTTFLPPEEEMEELVVKLRTFHESYRRALLTHELQH